MAINATKKVDVGYSKRALKSLHITAAFFVMVSIKLCDEHSMNTNPLKQTVQALIDSMKGPCLLDLADLMQTSVDKISDIFFISIMAHGIGAFSCK